ncbi:MAG: wax ester/triacylglycerol synthase family O-acyltransferase [Pseudomonadales bacterium]|nr:wax ester/triacylglycerol synthase family O-acyltransferase [Pseudomonadales bacterium]
MRSSSVSYRELMSVADTAWLRMDSPQNLMIINGVFFFEEHYPYERLVELLQERLLAIHRFRMRPIKDAGKYYWEEVADIDLEYHISSAALPETGCEESALKAFANDLISKPLDSRYPLWRFIHIDKYQGGTAVSFQIHHCYADGVALMAVLDAVADESVMHSSPAARVGMPRSSHVDGAGPLAAMRKFTQTSTFYTGFALGWLYEAMKVTFLPADSKTAYKQPLTTHKQVAWAPSLKVSEVKRIGKALGCTINDVVLACVAGSLRLYLERNGESAEGVTVRATVPVNLRPLSQAMNLGNKFGLVYLDLPVGESDSISRVKRVRKTMSKLKNGIQAFMSYNVLQILGRCPTAMQRTALNFFSQKASAVMTNVPGPVKPVMLKGSKLAKPMFWVPQSGDIGIGVSILSYNGKVEFGLIADMALIKDPQDVIDGFVVEYEQLRSRVLQNQVVKQPELAESVSS